MASDGRSNGAAPDPSPGGADERTVHEAIESQHELPGYYPIVVIARVGFEFESTLQATVASEQGDDRFRIRRRASRKGNYISYRVEVWVETGRAALARKEVIGRLEGVLVIL